MTWFDREVEVHMVETFCSDRRETDDENGAVCQEGSVPKLLWGACHCAVSVWLQGRMHENGFALNLSSSLEEFVNRYFVLDGLHNFDPIQKWPVGMHV